MFQRVSASSQKRFIYLALVRTLRTETIAQQPILGGFLTRLRPIGCGYGYSFGQNA